jgi:hypothetical protein
MAYVLRFVQRFRAKDEAAFMALEAHFLEAWTEVYEVLELHDPRRRRRRRAS